MPELRRDPVVGRWVIIATERARRPGNILDSSQNVWENGKTPCPFCKDGEVERATEKFVFPNGTGWKVKVVESGTPILRPREQFQRRGHGLYDVVNDLGTHEVVIETPEHTANMADLDAGQIEIVLKTYAQRFNDLSRNPKFKYALAYKNHGLAAGSRPIAHARSQIIAAPVTPLRVKEKLIGARKYFEYRDRCIYCDMVAQEREQQVRMVTENEHFIAIVPFAARFLFETWVLPRKHSCDFAKGVAGVERALAEILKTVLLKLKLGLDDPAYNFVVQTAPIGREKSKGSDWKTIEDDYHWHIEVIPRLTRVAGFEKGTGFYICSVPPEYAAEYLREVEI
jgi:UDPglucose--hexose-1-phosphate uridylyltransferase